MHSLRILIAIAAALLSALVPSDPAVSAGLALFVLIGLLWLTEALPLTYTALLVPVVGIALGLAPVKTALAGFAHPVIGLFLGGFALAAALSEHGIDRWLAHRLLNLARGRALPAALILAATTALLSMWISNTATTAMMLPVALGLCMPVGESFPRFRLFVLLALAWSANVGGIATLVGSPPNAITAAALGLEFNQWLAIGMPVFALLFPLALLVLYLAVRPESDVPDVDAGHQAPFPASTGAWTTLAIFFLTVALWVGGAPVASLLGIESSFDTWVALLAIVLLGITGSTRWQTIEHHANWGVLLLFGGGITLSTLMQTSGASAWLADGMSQWLPHGQPWLMYLMVALFVVFLTELVSNTASAALLVPLMMPVASAVGASTEVTALLIGLAASCAFMLPVATPPNALVFGSGYVPQKAMMRAGIILNLVAAGLLAMLVPVLA
jgi:sodium-dependent dicarboxylate transporter 2/3/5